MESLSFLSLQFNLKKNGGDINHKIGIINLHQFSINSFAAEWTRI